MNIHTRGLLVLVTLLVGCIDIGKQHHSLGWTGVNARATTWFGSDPKYGSIGGVSSEPPAFSVRFPGGRIIKPDEFTIAKLESHGAKKSLYVDPYHRKEFNTTELRIKSGAGTLFARFDVQNRLLSIRITANDREGTVFVGDRSGRLMIPMPASRDEFVELFGEPKREYP